MKTRGYKSSELKATILATIIGVILAILGIKNQVDLSDLAILIFAVVSPIAVYYPASRTIVKAVKGEKDV